VIVLVEEDNDNNDKKAKDCSTCLERINQALATKCQDWETKRKKRLEDLKKGKCFHEKNTLPSALDFEHNKVMEHKKTCSKCQKEHVARKSNSFGDEKKNLNHNCSQKPNEQQDEEEDNNDNSNNNKIAEEQTVRKYCKKNDIKGLEYDEESGKLIITYKSNKPKSELDNLSQELQEIKNYLKKNGHKDGGGKKYSLTEND